MKQCNLVNGLKKEDFMTLRWNANIHTVHQKNKEYEILNNQGVYLGKIVKDREGKDSYKIIANEKDTNVFSHIHEEIEKIKEIAEMIIDKRLDPPKIKEKINFSPYIADYQINLLRHAS